VLAAVDSKPETMPGAAAVDPFADANKAPGGLTPELRSVVAPSAPANRRQARAPSGNPLWAVPLSLLSATRERPIFSASRRPPPAPVAGVPVVEAPPPPVAQQGPIPPQLALLGTVANGNEGIGVFLDRATNNIVRLRTGAGHAGWILHAVRVRE